MYVVYLDLLEIPFSLGFRALFDTKVHKNFQTRQIRDFVSSAQKRHPNETRLKTLRNRVVHKVNIERTLALPAFNPRFGMLNATKEGA
jgi:hypothetical protein